MKKLALILFLTIPLGIFTFNSCTDPCADVVCNNGGICDEGRCDCPEGFSGPNCETDLCADCINGNCTTGDCVCETGYTGENCDIVARDKFIGIWNGIFDCPESVDTLLEEIDLSEFPVNMEILAHPDSLDLVILDAPDFPIDVFGSGRINGNTLTILPQTEEIDYQGIIIEATGSGLGELSTDTSMDLTVNISSSFLTFDCTATMQKQ